MGTTLTGTTPQDTYDSLIKVTDNGPLSGTAKYLSDGLGNDSALALSTARVGVNTNTPQAILHTQNLSAGINTHLQLSHENNYAAGAKISWFAGNNVLEVNRIENELTTDATTSGMLKFFSYTLAGGLTEKMRITGAGNVGIGTSSPSQKLTVYRNEAGNVSALIENAFINQGNLIQFNQNTTSGTVTAYIGHGGDATGDLTFFNGGSKQVSITSAGVLSLTQGQIKFPATQVASADPNTLDDYEEGTWTMGVSFGGGSTGVTSSRNTGTYTKIGRQVTVNGQLLLTNKGSSTGDANLTGLPFTIPNAFENYSAPSLLFSNITFANQFVGFGAINTTNISLGEVTEAGVFSTLTDADFANNSEVMINFTYFV